MHCLYSCVTTDTAAAHEDMSSTTPQENATRKDSGPRDPEATITAPERLRGRKRSHPSDAMDDSAPPNVKLPTAVSF